MKYLLTILIIPVFANFLFAQFKTKVTVSSYWDDNLYRSPEPASDLRTDIGIQLNYRATNSSPNFYYNGSGFLYRDNSLRNFSIHNAGITFLNQFGDDKRHNHYFGAELALRLHREEYNYYSFSQVYAYTNFRFDFDWLFLKGGYNFRYRNYSNLPDLTNYRHYLFIQANKSLKTRTTIILEVDLGYKSFAAHENYIASDDMAGQGYGRQFNQLSVTEIPASSQAVLLARISQSLHDKVGIYAQYRQQFSLNNEASYINSDGYYQDEELFDDPFSYESRSLSSQLTWIMPWSIKLQLGAAFNAKNYINEQAFRSAEDSIGLGGLRLDDENSAYLNLSKTLYLNRDWLKFLNFSINFNYIKNESNSYWYTYKNLVAGGGIQWHF